MSSTQTILEAVATALYPLRDTAQEWGQLDYVEIAPNGGADLLAYTGRIDAGVVIRCPRRRLRPADQSAAVLLRSYRVEIFVLAGSDALLANGNMVDDAAEAVEKVLTGLVPAVGLSLAKPVSSRIKKTPKRDPQGKRLWRMTLEFEE